MVGWGRSEATPDPVWENIREGLEEEIDFEQSLVFKIPLTIYWKLWTFTEEKHTNSVGDSQIFPFPQAPVPGKPVGIPFPTRPTDHLAV